MNNFSIIYHYISNFYLDDVELSKNRKETKKKISMIVILWWITIAIFRPGNVTVNHHCNKPGADNFTKYSQPCH
jgi:hypothetical protein